MSDLPDYNDDGPPTYQPRSSGSPWAWVLLAAVLLPLFACGLLTIATLGGVNQARQLIEDLFAGRLEVRQQQPSVIVAVQQLSRLETASYTVEKVLEGNVNREGPLGMFLGDRLLFVAHGEVVAGIDLKELQASDVVQGESGYVSLRLPPARVLTHSLDNEKSYVYDRQMGIFTRGNPQLETEVRRVAEQQILRAACEGGVLAQATKNAQTEIKALLVTLGYQQVEFQPSPAAPDSGC